MGLRSFFGSRIGSIEHLIMLPEIVYVDNFETARELRSKVNPKRYAIVHHPALVEEKGRYTFIDFTVFKGVKIHPATVSYALSTFYNDQFIGFEELKSSLDTLEQRIEESHAYRAATVARLEEAARNLYGGTNGADADQIISLIAEITGIQFEYPEHFIREAIQNADGSSSDKAANRIDVYIDRENRAVRVEDLGRGMSRHELDEYFFNLYRSMNEALEHAAGKFGIGALSFFGMRHEYVRVESAPETGVGGIAEIDANLYRDEFRDAKREKGTSVEIKFSESSGIDFDKVLSILKGDCRYVETPIYLHENGSIVRINEELGFPNAAQFNERNIEGFVYLVDGKGTLDLLDHRIRLASVDTIGYSGVANCSGLETVFSRDTVVENPVLEEVLRFVELKAKELRGNGHERQSLEQRLVNYRRFLTSTAFNEDGTPNEEWLRENYSIFENAQISFYLEPGSLIHSLAKLPLKGIYKLYNSSFGKFFKGGDGPFDSSFVYVPYSLIGFSLISTGIMMDEIGSKDIGGYVSTAGVPILLTPCVGFVESLTKFHAKRAMMNSYDRSINGTLTDDWGAAAAAAKVAKRLIRPIATVGAGIVLLGAAALATLSYLPGLYADRISGGGSNFISELFVNKGGSQSGIDYMTTEELATLLNDYEAKAHGNGEGYVSTDTSNVLEISSADMTWKDIDIEPANKLAVIGIDPQLPNILYQYRQADLTLEQKVSIVMNYIQNNFEYDAIAEEAGHGYPDPIHALLQEKKAICTGGNSLAAWMLYNLGAYDVREASGTLNGVPHLWLQVNYGNDSEPDWETTDFTPHNLSERLRKLLNERNGGESSFSFPDVSIPGEVFSYMPYFLGAAALISLAGFYFVSRRRNYSAYDGPITEEQESAVNVIQQYLHGADPSISVFYCSELQNASQLFVLKNGIVALNPSKQDYDPALVALSYAVKVLKDADLANSISAEMAG